MANVGNSPALSNRHTTPVHDQRAMTMRALAPGLVLWLLVSGFPSVSAETVERTFGARILKLEPLFYEPFDHDLSHWQVEGEARVTISRGFLQVDASEAPVTIWHREAFSGPQVVEYDVRLMPESLESNINMFLLADAPDVPGKIGTGRYKDYHAFPNYLITILNTTSPERRLMQRVRMRLNPGFELVSENWLAPLQYGRVYHVTYVLQPPRVSVYLDDHLVSDAVYEKRLDRGLHALRIWRTHSVYDNFQVSRIIE